MAGEGHEHGDGMLGRGDDIAGGGVDHHNALPRRRRGIDIIYANACTPDDLHARRCRENIGSDLRLAAHDQRAVVANDGLELLWCEAGALVNLRLWQLGAQRSMPSCAIRSVIRMRTGSVCAVCSACPASLCSSSAISFIQSFSSPGNQLRAGASPAYPSPRPGLPPRRSPGVPRA